MATTRQEDDVQRRQNALDQVGICARGGVFVLPASSSFGRLRTHLIYAAFGDLIEFPTFVPDRAFFLERRGCVRRKMPFPTCSPNIFATTSPAPSFITLLASHFTWRRWSSFAPPQTSARTFWPPCPPLAVSSRSTPTTTIACPCSLHCSYRLLCRCLPRIPPRSSLAAAVCFAALFAALYWAVAAVSLVFAVLVSLAELFTANGLAPISQAAIAAALAAAMGVWLFRSQCRIPSAPGLPIFPLGTALRTLARPMILFFPLHSWRRRHPRLASRLAARDRMPPNEPPHAAEREGTHPKTPAAEDPEICGPMAQDSRRQPLSLVPPPSSLSAAPYDPDLKHALQMNVLFRDRQWQAYIDAARRLPPRLLGSPG